MSTSAPTKHEQMTKETRRLLLEAAERIFIRDGYEKAELGLIASEAGRTKGSIYGHFKSKEELFLALVEARILRRRARMQELVAFSNDVEGNLAVMREHILEFATDDSWGLLLLEYKLFIVRHPEVKERLQGRHASYFQADEETRYVEMLGAAPQEEGAVSRTVAVRAMFAALSSLRLEAKFDPEVLSPDAIGGIAAKFFDVLFGAST